MKSRLIKVLLIEDDEDDVLLAKEYLLESEYYRFDISWEPNVNQAREKMTSNQYDIFLVDYRLGSENGLELIKYAQDQGVITPSILLTGQGDIKVDVDASRYGAADYLVKSELNPSVLERSIRYALGRAAIIRELDEKEKKYRSLFERSIDPIFLASETLQLTDVNTSFLSYFNYSVEDTLSMTIRDIFANEDDYTHCHSTLKRTEQIRDFEVELINKSGEHKICLLNCVFIPDQGTQFCCYQGIIHDLTVRKKAEKDMLLAERLSTTGIIARTIAHEVRNPLTNVTLALGELMDELPDHNQSIKLYHDIIDRNVNRINQLIDEMLNSSRPEELNLTLIDINEVLEEAIALAKDRMHLAQIKLEREFASNLPSLLVDLEKVRTAFLNVIINGLEAMQPGKGILKIVTTLSEGHIIVAIIDNGKGLSLEALDKLFDPFYTNKENGMGLGLTSTQNILNSHNATVDVKSKIDEGTTFIVSFKLAET
jgi:PAS domain S-box-containing protein